MRETDLDSLSIIELKDIESIRQQHLDLSRRTYSDESIIAATGLALQRVKDAISDKRQTYYNTESRGR